MKKLSLTGLLILSSLLFSCNPKTEKKQPTINYNNQNYKFDDDEIIKKETKKPEDKKTQSHKDKSEKAGV